MMRAGGAICQAEDWTDYVTLDYGTSVFISDWTESYDGRFGEFEAGVHYVVTVTLESVDEWSTGYYWVEGHWEQMWEDGVLISEYWVDGHWEPIP